MIFAFLPMAMLSVPLDNHERAKRELSVEAANYANRDGKAEAVAELAGGKPARLYTHIWNGRAPGYRTPGLTRCDPRYATIDPETLFRPLPEADWQEPGPFPPQYEAAVKFARAYNLTMYANRKVQIMRVCPQIGIAR